MGVTAEGKGNESMKVKTKPSSAREQQWEGYA
jgi:hypothetical protein